MIARLAWAAAILVAALLMPGTASAGGLPMHGNWCGPSHPDTFWEARLKPVDAMDAACYRHDMCYITQGIGDCGCDIRFMSELRRMAYPNPSLRAIGRAMYDAIAMVPCDDPMGWAYKQACVWRDLADDFITGEAMPWEMPLRWMYLGDRTLANKRWREGWP